MRYGQRLLGSKHSRARTTRRAHKAVLARQAGSLLLEALPYGAMEFSTDCTVTYANPEAGALFGIPPQELVGRTFRELGFVRVSDGRRLQDLHRWASARARSNLSQFIRLSSVRDQPVVGTRTAVLAPGTHARFAIVLWRPSHSGRRERAFMNFIDSVSDSIIVVDDDLNIIHANNAAADTFEPPSGPLVGQSFECLLAEPLTADDRRFLLGTRAESGVPRAREHRLFSVRDADGAEYTVEGSVSHIEQRDRATHTIILREISRRAAELAKVRKEMRLMRVVLDHTVAAMAAYDANEQLVAFNRGFPTIFGLEESDVRIGMKREEVVRTIAETGLLGPGSPEEVLARRRTVWRGPRAAYEELTLSDGRILTIRRRRMPDGGVISSFRDATERYRQARALQDAMAQLETASALQKSILDALPANVALLDEHGFIITVNESWREFADESGLDLDDHGVGSNYLDIARLTFAEPAESASDGIRDVLEGRRELFSFEYACHGPDNPRWFIMLVAPVGEDRMTGAVVMHMDVTERKLAERRVESGERRHRAIIESSGDAILTLDTEGRVLSGNPASERIFGHDERAIHGVHIGTILPAFPFFRASSDFVPTMPPLFRGEFLGAHKSGRQFPVEVVMSHVSMPEDDIYIVNIRDVSEQRTMQEELIQASKLSTLGEMAAGMAHEFNQPLSVMRMAADNALMRVERGNLQPDYVEEVLELISGQCERLGNMVLNLRTFARREDAAQRYIFNPIEAVGAACQLLRGKLALDSISIIRDFPESCRSVRGSGIQLEQVIINLLSNAQDAIVDHRRAKGAWIEDHVTISVRDHAPDDTVRITVRDTGGGIAEENLSKLFNPFFTTKDVGKGTGLGLSVSYGIISSMGGTITARNTEEGACFEITLPACDDSEREDLGEFPGFAGLPLMEGDRK